MALDRANIAKRLKDAVKWFVVSEELLTNDVLVLAAVSGGADSMAMLSVLGGLSKELNFRLAVAHFDHRLRESGDEERRLVEAYVRGLSVPFYSGSDDVAAIAKSSGDSLEEAARKARYRFLARLAEQIHASRIATGHTKNDQAETVLMRALRGAGIRGLAGIPARRGRIVRPFLTVGRADTRQYCEALDIPFVEDPSNQDTRFFRNRIRLELLPLLKADYHKGVENNLLRLAENAQEVLDGIRVNTGPLIKQNLRRSSSGEWTLNIARIARLDDTSIFVLFGDLVAEELGRDADLCRVHYEQLAQLVKDSRGSGKKLSLPGLTVKREYENLLIAPAKMAAAVTNAIDYRATLTFPGETRAAGVVVKTEIVERSLLSDANIKATDKVAYFALNRLKLPLTLRGPSAGDRMQPFGMTGNKKLSDMFIDKKIPARRRTASIVVTDAQSILWLVGVTTSEKSRIGADTEKVVRITIRNE